MILNLPHAWAEHLLRSVDAQAVTLIARIPKSKSKPAQDLLILELKVLAIVKHRLEYGLGIHPPFRGPIEWGYPRHEDPDLK